MYRLLALCWLYCGVAAAFAQCPESKLQIERLPNLQIPRADPSVFVVNGEPTVVGGHTDGFVPTATAEYYSDGEWHLLETVYPHDHGFSVPLRSGQVLIGGGHSEPLGIGHIFSVEMYDPARHTFRGFGCSDRKRCFATGIEQDSGRVVITGNWFNGDGIELFDGQKYFTHVKDVSQPRACPFVLPVAAGDAFIFGNMDYHADAFDTVIVDRLRGEPLRVPLFDEWKPLRYLTETRAEDCHIGNRVYLIPVINSDGQVAVCHVDSTGFSLLPTAGQVPMTYQGGAINYYHSFYTDRQARRAYLFGYGSEDGRLFVLAVGYDTTPASLTLYYTDPMEPRVWTHPVLTPDGNLLIAGGAKVNADGTVDNFAPVATTLLLSFDRPQAANQPTTVWLWLLLAALLLLATAVTVHFWQRKPLPVEEDENVADSVEDSAADEALMLRICQLMDEERPYLNSELKIADMATLLGTNVTYISNCINSQKGCSFIQFVNGYRIDYAKQLLRKHPDKKISEVWAASGFANETSFFRNFKALTGMTPNEWRAKID
ncbi:MAG: helix-turn-helix domain-containing protein [Prevotella sp.]|nr:helix-turn-helix domain-containing protein [Prevotella sp.]